MYKIIRHELCHAREAWPGWYSSRPMPSLSGVDRLYGTGICTSTCPTLALTVDQRVCVLDWFSVSKISTLFGTSTYNRTCLGLYVPVYEDGWLIDFCSKGDR